MAARTANALWEGSLKEGRGQMAVGSGAFEGSYSFQSRFGDDDTGTNPEELVAAALAGCYSMQLSAVLGEAGNQSESVQSTAEVTLRNVDGAPTITKIALTTRAKVPGIEEAAFQEAVGQAKAACLIARALAGVQEITVDASLDR
jgi:osmotically inducible protein OsmC